MSTSISGKPSPEPLRPSPIHQVKGKYYLDFTKKKGDEISSVALRVLKNPPKDEKKYSKVTVQDETYYINKKTLREKYSVKHKNVTRGDLEKIKNIQRLNLLQTTSQKRETPLPESPVVSRFKKMESSRIPQTDIQVDHKFLDTLNKKYYEMRKNNQRVGSFRYEDQNFVIRIKNEGTPIEKAEAKVYLQKGSPATVGNFGDILFLHNTETIFRRTSEQNLLDSTELLRGGKAMKSLKSVPKETEEAKVQKASLLNEGKALKRIRDHEADLRSQGKEIPEGSEYVVKGYATTHEGQPSLMMKRYDGNLTELLKRTGKRALTFEQRVEIARQLAHGLAYLHSFDPPLIHFDLKPDNILFIEDKQNNTFKIAIGDLGSATNAEYAFAHKEEPGVRGFNLIHYTQLPIMFLSQSPQLEDTDAKVYDEVGKVADVRALSLLISKVLLQDVELGTKERKSFPQVSEKINLSPKLEKNISQAVGKKTTKQFINTLDKLNEEINIEDVSNLEETRTSFNDMEKKMPKEFFTSAVDLASQLEVISKGVKKDPHLAKKRF